MKNLLILDKEEYKKNNKEILELMNKLVEGNNEIIYTSYEDQTIRKVRNYKYIGSFLQHTLYWKKSYIYARDILKKKYDNIYCINPIVGIFLGLKNKKSKIVLAGFLFEPKNNKIYYLLRKKITNQSLKGIYTAIVYSSKEVEYYKSIFGNVTKFKFLKYGSDFSNLVQYSSSNLPTEYFFSGGGSNRDYETLVNAYNKISSESKLVVATQPWRMQGMNTSKINILGDVVIENFGDVLKKSKALILSLKDSNISVGHMVMLQAMSLGIPIIINDISAIRDYVDENSVTFYPSGDVERLCEILQTFKEENYKEKTQNAMNLYHKELTFKNLLNRILQE